MLFGFGSGPARELALGAQTESARTLASPDSEKACACQEPRESVRARCAGVLIRKQASRRSSSFGHVPDGLLQVCCTCLLARSLPISPSPLRPRPPASPLPSPPLPSRALPPPGVPYQLTRSLARSLAHFLSQRHEQALSLRLDQIQVPFSHSSSFPQSLALTTRSTAPFVSLALAGCRLISSPHLT